MKTVEEDYSKYCQTALEARWLLFCPSKLPDNFRRAFDICLVGAILDPTKVQFKCELDAQNQSAILKELTSLQEMALSKKYLFAMRILQIVEAGFLGCVLKNGYLLIREEPAPDAD